MTPIESIKAFAAANPTARVWVEEALFRGAPSTPGTFGVISGAHFIVGVESPNPLGQPTRQLLGPFPAFEVPTGDNSTMAELIGVAVIIQQQTIDEQASTIAARDSTIAGQAQQITERDAVISGQVSTIESRDARIAELETALADRDAAASTMQARIAELEAVETEGTESPQ